jgi:hypothetical protein
MIPTNAPAALADVLGRKDISLVLQSAASSLVPLPLADLQ